MPPRVTTARTIRLGPAHLDAAHALSQAENWPHRRAEWEFLLGIGSGFGLLSGRRLVGTAVLVPYGVAAATVGMIIVAAEARGSGLGRQLTQRLLDALGPRECRLTATEAGRPLYESLGFTASGDITQWQGTVTTAPPPPPGTEIATEADLAQIIALDQAASGMDRGMMLARLAASGGEFLLLRHGGALCGYAACRPFGRGTLLGPLVASDDDGADLLLRRALARHAGAFLRVDLTAAGRPHLPLLQAAGLQPAGTALAMTRPGSQPCPAPRLATIHSLASQALC